MYFRPLKPKSLPWIAEKAGWTYDRLSRWIQGQKPNKDKAPTVKELQKLKRAVSLAKSPLDRMEKRIDREIESLINEK